MNLRLLKKNSASFKPPLSNQFHLQISKRLLLRPAISAYYKITHIEYPPADLDRLEALRDERVVLIPNHPSKADGAVMFELSHRANQDFYILANRESFDDWLGLWGKWMQRCGAYSVARGARDVASSKATASLLASAPNKLVIFPEGGAYSRYGQVFPFQDPVFHLLRYATLQMKKAGCDRPLYIQPVAIKYRIVGDMSPEISQSLRRLERELELADAVPNDLYERLMRVCFEVLRCMEVANRIRSPHGESIEKRIEKVREAIMSRVETSLGTVPLQAKKANTNSAIRTRELINHFYQIMRTDELPESQYGTSLLNEEFRRMKPIRRDIDRLGNWMPVREGYVKEHPTQERYVDMLLRLEYEVLGRSRLKGPTRCIVRLGRAFDLRDFMKQHSNDEVDRAAALLTEENIRTLLEETIVP